MTTVALTNNLPNQVREALKLALTMLDLSIPTDHSVQYIQAVASRKVREYGKE